MRRRVVERLRARWEQRAASNPLHAIAADRSDWAPADFLQSGEDDAVRFVDPVLPLLACPPSECTALDIGCGVGRVARALARRFARVEGIDLAPTMLAKAPALAPLPPNLRLSLCDGSGTIPLESRTVDFGFSYVVFQHVTAAAILRRYFAELARVLRPGGLALVQVNTARRPLWRRLRVGIVKSERMPLVHLRPRIALEPHSPMGVVLPVRRILGFARDLSVLRVEGQGTQYTWLLLRR